MCSSSDLRMLKLAMGRLHQYQRHASTCLQPSPLGPLAGDEPALIEEAVQSCYTSRTGGGIMETAKLTVRLPKTDLDFAKEYAQAHRITVTELIDRYLRSLRG